MSAIKDARQHAHRVLIAGRAAADAGEDDDASQCDVIAAHPGHLLLSSISQQ